MTGQKCSTGKLQFNLVFLREITFLFPNWVGVFLLRVLSQANWITAEDKCSSGIRRRSAMFKGAVCSLFFTPPLASNCVLGPYFISLFTYGKSLYYDWIDIVSTQTPSPLFKS